MLKEIFTLLRSSYLALWNILFTVTPTNDYIRDPYVSLYLLQ